MCVVANQYRFCSSGRQRLARTSIHRRPISGIYAQAKAEACWARLQFTFLLTYLIYCTLIADVNSTDVPVCRHSTRLWAWSSSSPLVFPHRTLAVPRTRTTLGDRSFAVAGPRVWNSLPATIRQITSYGQFRQRLKAYFFTALKSQRIVTTFFRCMNIVTYLLT